MGKVKGILIGLSILIGLLVLDYSSILWSGVTRTKREEVRREVFEETKSYNEGKEQDLLRYRLQYLKAEGDEKEAIASTVRMMFADYDESKLSFELRDFLKEIKYGGEY